MATLPLNQNIAIKEFSVQAHQIAEASRNPFMRHGFRRTTIDDIAAAAGVARNTIYLHFSSKAEVLNLMLAKSRQRLQQVWDEAMIYPGTLRERLYHLLAAHYLTVHELAGGFENISSVISDYYCFGDDKDKAFESLFKSRVAQLFSEAHASGELPQMTAPADDIRFILYAAKGAALETPFSVEHFRHNLQRITDYVCDALGAPKSSPSGLANNV